MKNHRDVCSAHEAGYAEFNGLPGKVKTGCPNTPQPMSRYCPAHTPTVFTPQWLDPGDDVSDSSSLQAIPSHKDQVAYIVSKKTTRHTTFYEVCCLERLKCVSILGWVHKLHLLEPFGCTMKYAYLVPHISTQFWRISTCMSHIVHCWISNQHITITCIVHSLGCDNWKDNGQQYMGACIISPISAGFWVWEWSATRISRR